MKHSINMVEYSQKTIPAEIRELYESSFPASEKVNWKDLIDKLGRQASLFGFEVNNAICGFMYLHQNATNAHIGFFAVKKELRGRGLGTEMLKLLSAYEKDRTISLEIEDTEEDCEDHDVRVKRKNFYLHAGFVDSGIRFYYEKMIWELLANQPINKQKHYDLIHDVFPETADHFVYLINHKDESSSY